MSVSRTLALSTCCGIAAVLACGSTEGVDPKKDPANIPVPRACIKDAACGVRAYPTVQGCVDNYSREDGRSGGAVNGVLRCAARATTCTEVRACHGRGELCTRDYKASCAGGVAMFCDLFDDRVYSYRCGSEAHCRVDPDFPYDATCWSAIGAEPALPTLVDCSDGRCQITRAPCTVDDRDTCDGEQLKSCIDGHWVIHNCIQLGLGPCKLNTTVPTDPFGTCGPAWET